MTVIDPELSNEPREQAFAAVYRADQMHETSAPGLTGRAERLALGTLGHLEELDAAINDVSDHWRVDRMPAVDRALLRLAVYELQFEPKTPVAVILSESVRIAKEYSTQASGRFVNGVLATLATRLRE